MNTDITILLFTPASIGFLNTLTEPDHYLQFIVMGKARNWKISKMQANLLITPVRSKVKHKWAFPNLVSVIRQQLKNYINIYGFLEDPEGSWCEIIKENSSLLIIELKIQLLINEEILFSYYFLFWGYILDCQRCKLLKNFKNAINFKQSKVKGFKISNIHLKSLIS